MLFRIFYAVAINVYEMALWILAGFSLKIRKMVLGRAESFGRIKQFRKENKDGIIFWFHAASVGEFEQAVPVMRLLKEENPDLSIAVSFYSPSGFELKKRHPLVDLAFYLPADRLWVQARLMRHLKPQILILVKYEFWFNLIFAAHRLSIPVYSICCILTPEKVNHLLYGPILKRTLSMVQHFFVQNIETSQVLKQLGMDNLTLNGDTRVDRVLEIKDQEVDIPWIEGWKGNHKLLIIGSAWLEDLIYLKDFLQHAVVEAHGLWRVLIVPHEVDPANLDRMSHALGLPHEHFSKWELAPDETDILILDRMGLLSKLYRFADAAWIGGGFKTGLHNSLEAAVFGIPVGFGPRFSKFQEAKDLIQIGVARHFPEMGSVWEFFQEATEIEEEREKISESARKYFDRQRGAAKTIVQALSIPGQEKQTLLSSSGSGEITN